MERNNDELRSRNTRLSDESLRLTDDLKASSAELFAAQEKQHDLLLKLAESEEKNLPLQYELSKLRREKELVEQQNKWLEGESAARSNEVMRLKADLSLKTQDLESKVLDLSGQCESYKETTKSLQV